VLLNASARDALKKAFEAEGEEGKTLYGQTIQAIRDSMQSGIRSVFLIGAVSMLLAFLIICTIPRNAIDEVQHDVPLKDVASSAK